jgi:hypothetical protein
MWRHLLNALVCLGDFKYKPLLSDSATGTHSFWDRAGITAAEYLFRYLLSFAKLKQENK